MVKKDTGIEVKTEIESNGRRKAVKTMVGGAVTLAAYHLMPTKWGVPIIEQVFLPAHAATSGTSTGTNEITLSIGNSAGGTAMYSLTATAPAGITGTVTITGYTGTVDGAAVTLLTTTTVVIGTPTSGIIVPNAGSGDLIIINVTSATHDGGEPVVYNPPSGTWSWTP